MNKISTAGLAIASAAALVLLGAAPAQAAGNAIDPGDSLYSVACDEGLNEWQLFGVDSSTAFSTKVGEGSGTPAEYFACGYQPAYDFATGTSYYIQLSYDGDNEHSALAQLDVTSGVSTTINEFLWIDGEFPTLVNVDAIAIGPNSTAFALADGILYSLDLDDATLLPVGSSLVNTYAFAYDQKLGEFYAIDDENNVFLVDTTDGSYSSAGFVSIATEYSVYSLQFDEAGTLWMEVDEDEGASGLYSATFATLDAPVYSGTFSDDPYYTEGILIIPGVAKAALAATGTDASALPLTVGVAGMLLLAGVSVVAIRRRRTV